MARGPGPNTTIVARDPGRFKAPDRIPHEPAAEKRVLLARRNAAGGGQMAFAAVGLNGPGWPGQSRQPIDTAIGSASWCACVWTGGSRAGLTLPM